MKNSIKIHQIVKTQKWQKIAREIARDDVIHIGQKQINNITGINEKLSADQIQNIYIPLANLIGYHIDNKILLQNKINQIFENNSDKTTFIIAIAGSVAAGKSTLARLLVQIFAQKRPKANVKLVTTDGFLFDNKTLKQKNLMHKKGFPQSYQIEKIIRFLSEIKSQKKNIKIPIYSHLYYDIIENRFDTITKHVDIMIFEGLNVLQTPRRQNRHSARNNAGNSVKNVAQNVFVSDFFDFSIYLDASEKLLEKWYIERFLALRTTAFSNPQSFFKRFAKLSKKEAIITAQDIWTSINLPNLKQNIEPTKQRANVILQKTKDHIINNIAVRKM